MQEHYVPHGEVNWVPIFGYFWVLRGHEDTMRQIFVAAVVSSLFLLYFFLFLGRGAIRLPR